MTRNDFRQKALIHIASALVKVMDEQRDGVLDNEASHTQLAVNAVSIMSELEDAAMPHDPMNDHGIYFDDDDEDWEDDETPKAVMQWHPIREKPQTGMYLVHEVWPNGKPFCITASYDEETNEWRPWDDIEVVGMPLDETQRSMITHWMPIVDPGRGEE